MSGGWQDRQVEEVGDHQSGDHPRDQTDQAHENRLGEDHLPHLAASHGHRPQDPDFSRLLQDIHGQRIDQPKGSDHRAQGQHRPQTTDDAIDLGTDDFEDFRLGMEHQALAVADFLEGGGHFRTPAGLGIDDRQVGTFDVQKFFRIPAIHVNRQTGRDVVVGDASHLEPLGAGWRLQADFLTQLNLGALGEHRAQDDLAAFEAREELLLIPLGNMEDTATWIGKIAGHHNYPEFIGAGRGIASRIDDLDPRDLVELLEAVAGQIRGFAGGHAGHSRADEKIADQDLG